VVDVGTERFPPKLQFNVSLMVKLLEENSGRRGIKTMGMISI